MTLRLLGIGPGDEVITCAYTYTATASVVCHVGAKLVLVDCSEKPGSIEMDYDALEKVITPKTKAIIPIDLGGIPCDYDRIFEIVERKRNLFVPSNNIQKAIGRIAVIADSAHAFGSSYHGTMVGSVADFSNFSFHAVKNFTTGEGGCMTWRHIEGIDDDELYHQVQLLSLHGQSKDALAKTKIGAWEYDIVGPWYKCNMTDIAAAVGLAQFERYPKMLERRKQIIEQYDAAFRPLGLDVLDHYTDSYRSCGHLYLVRVPGITAEQRNEIIIKMAKQKVVCNVHYKPLPLHTAYINLGFDMKNYPNAFRKYANEITLPLYSKLTDKDIEYIISTFTNVVKDYLK
jgi:dTDP-4-amino-4,6-dideoxygalactose transaminase